MLRLRYEYLALIGLLAIAAGGCRAPAAAPAATPPALPTSASVGGANIVAISPPGQQCCPKQTLPQFLGITGACEGIKQLIDRLRNRLGAIWPGLEAKPEILSITDPANMESDNPAVASAAAVKAEEDAAAQKAKAIAYLASVGCAGCYPGIEDALLAALDDCTELVRFETAKALRSTATMPCKNCCRSACCGPKIREKLVKLAYETDAQGCYLESSDRVRRMARLAIANCNCVPDKPGQATPQERLPAEGPGPEEMPAPATVAALPSASATQTASVLRPSAPMRDNAVRAMSYEEAIGAYAGGGSASVASEMEVAWELWTARPEDFASRAEAVSAMTMARMQMMSSQPGHVLPPQLRYAMRDWADPNSSGSPSLARAVATTPVGGVSGVIEDHLGWHLVRVMARRSLQEARMQATPAAAQQVQPVSHQSLTHPIGSGLAAPRITAVRQADCNCK